MDTTLLLYSYKIFLSQFEDCPGPLLRNALVFSVQTYSLKVHVHSVLLTHCNIRCTEILGVRRLILECLKGRWYFKCGKCGMVLVGPSRTYFILLALAKRHSLVAEWWWWVCWWKRWRTCKWFFGKNATYFSLLKANHPWSVVVVVV